MASQNPYEHSSSDDSESEKPWTKFGAAPMLFVLSIALVYVTGATIWRNMWDGLIFFCPAAAIIIAATQFGLVTVAKSVKFVATFVGVSVTGYIAFAATCTGVNLATITNIHSMDEGRIGIIAIVTTLLGCICSFLLSRRFLRPEK